MSSKLMKIISFAMVLLMVFAVVSPVFAAGDLLDPSQVVATVTDTSGKVNTMMGKILGIVQVVAIGIAVIMLVVLAVKYIAAAPAEKADIKKGMMIYVVGAVLLFGASGILQLIKNFTEGGIQ